MERKTNPRWSPDGKTILFISSRKIKEKRITRLKTMPAEGGHARTILEFQKGKIDGKIKDPRWTPDGKRILFLSDLKRKKKTDSDVKVVTRILYRLNAEGYFHDRRTHLYSIKRTGGKPDSADIRGIRCRRLLDLCGWKQGSHHREHDR